MATTEFGKIVRIARVKANVNLSEMAMALGVSAAFLSALETGRKKISPEWVQRIGGYVRDVLKDPAPTLEVAADMTNQTVALEGLSPQHQMLVAGFARMGTLDEETERKFHELLQAASKVDK